jgi:DNA-binding helix-hairpin-helix protein with protein kinase domain
VRNTTVPLAALGGMSRLNAGANGTIHRLDGFKLPDEPGDLVFKEYNLKTVQVALGGLERLAGVRLSLVAQRRAVLDDMTAWPLRAVVGPADEARGVLMKLIPGRYFEDMLLPSGNRDQVAREIQHLIFDADVARRRDVAVPDDTDLRTRLRICERFAYLLSILHGANLVYGDVSARNVLYSLRPDPSVFLVDCDAARVRGSAAVNKQQHSPDWDPPERTAGQSVITDRYKLALFVLRVLTPGKGSSLNRDWRTASGALDGAGLKLLRLALDGAPGDRPMAREWVFYLRAALGVAAMPVVAAATRTPPRETGWRRGPHGWVPA